MNYYDILTEQYWQCISDREGWEKKKEFKVSVSVLNLRENKLVRCGQLKCLCTDSQSKKRHG